jgi:hypothetical protein
MKKKIKKSTTKKGVLAQYKAKNTKGDIANTGIKTVVDLLLGSTIGAGIGAGAGRAAIPIGILLIAGSHYLDEGTGVLRVAGSATIAYGIGKAITNQQIAGANQINGLAGETSKAKIRLNLFKDEIFTAFYLDKIFKPKEEEVTEETSSEAVGQIDVSVLDAFEEDVKRQAIQFELEKDNLEGLEEDYLSEVEDFSFAMIDENPDLTNI